VEEEGEEEEDEMKKILLGRDCDRQLSNNCFETKIQQKFYLMQVVWDNLRAR